MPRFTNVTYGHRQLWLFCDSLFELTGDGFNHAGRDYRWSDLGMIRITQVPVPMKGQGTIVHFGRADIHLSDGTAVRLRAEDVVKRGALLSRGYETAFDELVSIFQEKRREHLKELEAQGASRDAA